MVPFVAEATPRSFSLAPMLLRTSVPACREAAVTRGVTLTRGSATELVAAGRSTPARKAMAEFRRAEVKQNRELALGRTGAGRSRPALGQPEPQVIGRTTARTATGEAVEAEVLGYVKEKPELRIDDVPDAEVVAEYSPRALGQSGGGPRTFDLFRAVEDGLAKGDADALAKITEFRDAYQETWGEVSGSDPLSLKGGRPGWSAKFPNVYRLLAAVAFAVGAAAAVKKYGDLWKSGQEIRKSHPESTLSVADANKQLAGSAVRHFEKIGEALRDNPHLNTDDIMPAMLGVGAPGLTELADVLRALKKGELSDGILSALNPVNTLTEIFLKDENREAVAVLIGSGEEAFNAAMPQLEQVVRDTLRSLAEQLRSLSAET
jgi:hypothetical protein